MFLNMGICNSCHCKCRRKSDKKIVLMLVGLDNSGKTTVLKGLSGESTENAVPSVGFSNSRLTFEGYDVEVYDLGGGQNIRGIWSKYFMDVHGLIFVVDASDAEKLPECRKELEALLTHEKLAGKPMLVLANKQDVPGALDELDLVDRLGLEGLVNRQKCPTSVETCAALISPDPAVQNGYKWLVDTILHQFPVLDSRVQADMEAQRLVDERLRRERQERIEKIRAEREKESNGHTKHEEEEEGGDFDRNPFRPISELTAEDRATPGTKMILVQQSPSKESETKDERTTTSQDSTKSLESLPFTSPTNSVIHLVKEGSLEDGKPKKRGLFSRSNKTAPMPDSSPVRKATLPPLKQPAAIPPESVPWIKPVLSTGRTTPNQDGAWGLDQALEPVSLTLEPMGSRLTELSRPSFHTNNQH